MINAPKFIPLPVLIENILSTLLKTTATSLARTLGEIASNYSTSAFLPSSMKDDTRYIELLIKYQAMRNNKLDYLPMQLQSEFSQQLFELLSEWQANQIHNQVHEIRPIFEKKNLATIFSQEETFHILEKRQKKYRLLVLVSPPNVSRNCPSSFQHDLPIELAEKLKFFLHNDYSVNSELCPVEFYSDYFMRSINDADVLQLQQILAPVPTVVMDSKITDYEVYFNVNFWHPQNNNITKICMSAWNWEEVNEALQAADYDEIRAIRTIRQIIVTIHQLLAAFITDWYYLHLSHIYEPQLFHLESELALGRWSSDLLRPYIDTLKDIYLQQKSGYEQNFKHLIDDREHYHGIEKSIIQSEYWKIGEEKTLNIHTKSGMNYSKLRYFLAEKKWQEADEETTKLMLNIAGKKINDLPLEQAEKNQLFLSDESLQNFTCEDLRIIDKLWLKYSNLHFGFSIQTCIWQTVSQNDEDINLNCKYFADHVGWLVNGKWINYDQINYELDAPIGHLPFDFTKLFPKTDGNNGDIWYDLYYRIQACEL